MQTDHAMGAGFYHLSLSREREQGPRGLRRAVGTARRPPGATELFAAADGRTLPTRAVRTTDGHRHRRSPDRLVIDATVFLWQQIQKVERFGRSFQLSSLYPISPISPTYQPQNNNTTQQTQHSLVAI
jgi:hypothetical protein